MNRRVPNKLIAIITAIATLITGVSYGPVEVPVVADTTYVTYVTEDQRDVQEQKHSGIRALLRDSERQEVRADTLSIQQAPQLNWVNLDVRDGREMVWCLKDTQYEQFRQVVRNTLNQMSSIDTPDKIKWREACPAPYTIGDDSTAICGQGSLACASVQGLQFRGARISVAKEQIENGNLREGMPLVGLHEGLHAITTSDHTFCGPNPDSEESLLSPFNTTTQLPCHEPPARGLVIGDYRLAGPKYGIQFGVQPTPTPTPAPPPAAVTQIIFRRWTLPSYGENCRPNVDDWCVDQIFQLPPNGFAWIQILRSKQGQEEHIDWQEIREFMAQQAVRPQIQVTPPSR